MTIFSFALSFFPFVFPGTTTDFAAASVPRHDVMSSRSLGGRLRPLSKKWGDGVSPRFSLVSALTHTYALYIPQLFLLPRGKSSRVVEFFCSFSASVI